MHIYKFNSILKPVLWGGDKLVRFKHLPATDEPIGESWELSAFPGRESVVTDGEDRGLTLPQLVERYGADLVGEDVYRRYGDSFPLLIKVIDAHRDLSIQVHPDEEMALRRHGCHGKNEMWYILNADDGAVIRAGFNSTITQDEYDRKLADGTLLDVVNADSSRPGDVFFIPAGQIHSIGAGNMVVEIQQSSDITYRVWDYNRRDADGNLRQLHVQEAREALDFTARDCQVHDFPCIAEGMKRLVRCPEFEVNRLDFDDGYVLEMPQPHSFVALFCTKGATLLSVEGMPPQELHQGELALVPAVVDRVEMTDAASVLLTTVPPLTD
jgi:mannose-6-phosphate isomerase